MSAGGLAVHALPALAAVGLLTLSLDGRRRARRSASRAPRRGERRGRRHRIPSPVLAVIATIAEPDVMLGTVSWHWESEVSGWRRMGVTVYDPQQRGRGVGTAALALWTDYLFRATDVVRLDYSTWSGNERMLTVGRRLGFREEARFRDARVVRGERYDAVVMGILRSEWEQRGPHS